AGAIDDAGPCDYEIVIRLLSVAKHGGKQRSNQCEGRNQSGDHAQSRNLGCGDDTPALSPGSDREGLPSRLLYSPPCWLKHSMRDASLPTRRWSISCPLPASVRLPFIKPCATASLPEASAFGLSCAWKPVAQLRVRCRW